MFRLGSRFGAVFATASVFVSFVVPAAQARDEDLVARVGAYVERYYARAQTLIATETVTVQPITRRLQEQGSPRRMVNEVRIEWQSTRTDPLATRQVIDARGPRLGPPGQPDCLDPRSFTIEPLALLLPANRHKYRFTVGRTETIATAIVRRIDYEPRAPGPPRVRWDGRCGWVDSFGRTRGRVWVDASTGAVLRFEERLSGRVALPGPDDPDAPRFIAERADTTVDYRMFTFADPDETLLLPSRVESITFIRNSAVSARVTRTFDNYRRFLTGGRVIP